MDREEVVSLYNKIKNYSRTGDLLGISRQRVHQIVTSYHNLGRSGRKNKYRDFEMCKVCGQFKAKALHHKDFNNQNDSKENLLPVCTKCHYNIHSARGNERNSWLPRWVEVKTD